MEIVYQYKPLEGFYINKVLAINERTLVVLNTKYRAPSTIHILVDNCIVRQIDLSAINDFDSSSSENSFFIFNTGFGLINYTDTILLWETISSEPYIIVAANVFAPEWAGKRYTTTFADFYANDGCLYFGLENFRSGFPARYWAILAITDRTAKWSRLHELPSKNYPETKLRQLLESKKAWDFYLLSKEKDWLNINGIMVKDDCVYIPTDGGGLTRAKSGLRYEYSLISILDLNNNLIRNQEIEEGIGSFTFDKKRYLLQSRNKKNKVLVYDTSYFKIESELTISPKQNLGNEKNSSLVLNIVGQMCYLYNAFFLNVCIIK